jgi:four helix bundle protein
LQASWTRGQYPPPPLIMQNLEIKMQNGKENFKEAFNKRLIKFSIDILNFAEKLRKRRIFWTISDQLIRSATSIGANVTEAKSSSSKKEYVYYFEVALKSANETKYWLILIKETALSFKDEVKIFLDEIEEISKILGTSVLTLKRSKEVF